MERAKSLISDSRLFESGAVVGSIAAKAVLNDFLDLGRVQYLFNDSFIYHSFKEIESIVKPKRTHVRVARVRVP